MRLNRGKTSATSSTNQSSSILNKKALQHFNLRRRIKLSPNLKKGLMSFSAIALLVGVIAISRPDSSAITTPNPVNIQSIITETSTETVANFEIVSYRAEVIVKDNDATNVLTTLTLNNKASWTALPSACRLTADIPSITPTSEIKDTTGDGLNDTLICNFGDHPEGTKLAIFAEAGAAGNNEDIIVANIGQTADGFTGSTAGYGEVQTTIAAPFDVVLDKSLQSRENEDDYVPLYHPADFYGAGSPVGRSVDFHVGLSYANGSELVADDGSGLQSFTILDTWRGTHSNDPTVEGNNAVGDYDDEIVLLGTVTGNTADSCSLVDSTVGTVTCTQAGPGEPVTIQIDGVQVNQATIAKVSMQLFFPFEEIFYANGFAEAETYSIDNFATLIDWGNSPDTLLTSASGATNPGPFVDNKDALVNAIPPGSFSLWKFMDGHSSLQTGARTASPGEKVETTLLISDERPLDTVSSICDTIDTSVFEYAGYLPSGQLDAIWHGDGAGSFTNRGSTGDQRAFLHDEFNPKLLAEGVYKGAPGPTPGRALNATDYGVVLEFSNLSYAATGDNHWDATCEDDMDGNGSNDWVTDATTLTGGIASVTRVRLTFNRVVQPIYDEMIAQTGETVTRHAVYFSFDLKVKDSAPTGQYAPNTAATFDRDVSYWQGAGGPEWRSTRNNANGEASAGAPATYFGVQDDPNHPLFSFTSNIADRVYVIPGTMSINKSVDSEEILRLLPGETATYLIDPATTGSGATGITMTFTDTLPDGMSHVSDTCASVYASAGLTCTVSVSGQVVTYTVTGYDLGDDLPEFSTTAVVDVNALGGSKLNTVTISSDYAPLSDDSHCDDAVDANGNPSEAIEARCRNTFGRYHSSSDRVFVIVLASATKVVDSTPNPIVPLNSNVPFNMTYSNNGSEDVGAGQIISPLPVNGDGGCNTERLSAKDGTSTTATVGFVSFTPSVAGETVEYTTTPVCDIDPRPCHPSNWPAGDTRAAGTNPILDSTCSQGLLSSSGEPSLTEPGTGATTWIATADINALDDATKASINGIRISTPAMPAGELPREMAMTVSTPGSSNEDVICHNYGYNAPLVTLDTISNDACVSMIRTAVGDTIYYDDNGNDIQDPGELGIEGVQVDITCDNGSYVASLNTDADGKYLFENMPLGDCTVTVVTPPQYAIQTQDPDGGADNTSQVTLTAENFEDLDQDFGYLTTTIGNYVWADTNSDGVQDPTELGIPNVTVKLINAGPDGLFHTGDDSEVGTRVTDANGEYYFRDIEPGKYCVVIDTTTLPEGFTQTFDASGGLDHKSELEVELGDVNLLQDFGYHIPLAQTGSNTMILTLLALGAITALGSVVSFRAYGRAV